MLLYLLHSVRKINSSYITPLWPWVQSLFSQGSHVCLCLPLSMTMLCSLPPPPLVLSLSSPIFDTKHIFELKTIFIRDAVQAINLESLHKYYFFCSSTNGCLSITYCTLTQKHRSHSPQTYLKKHFLFFLFNLCFNLYPN